MSKVLITRSKLDGLASTIAAKSGAALPLTLDQMDAAVRSISGGDVTVEALNVTSNGTYTAQSGKAYSPVTVNVPSGTPSLQSKTATPTEQQQTVQPDSGYDGLSQVTVNPIPSQYIVPTGTKSISENGTGIDVAQYASVDVAVEDSTLVVTLSYNEQTELWEPDCTYTEAYAAYQDGKDIVFEAAEYDELPLPVTGEYAQIFNSFHYDVHVPIVVDDYIAGYTTKEHFWDATRVYIGGNHDAWYPIDATAQPSQVAEGAVFYNVNGKQVGTATPSTPTLQSKSVSYTPSETAQSATVTADGGYDGLSSVDVSVGAISSTYVGSGIDQRDSDDLTASGATVTVPAGYYSAQASKAVASGTAGTPTATKGTVSNHSVSVTPSVTNTTGYITGDTKSGTAVTVSASELVSGTYTVSASGTHDVTNYASASVAAGGATASATKGTVSNHSVTVTPSVTRTAGYVTAGTADGTEVTVSASELVSGTKAITGSGTTDVTEYASVSVASGGATASATKGTVSNHSVTVTPSVTRTAGWVTAGSSNGTAVTVSASELVSGSETKTENGTYDVTNLASLVVNVAGGGSAYRRIEVCPQQTATPNSSRQATLSNVVGSLSDGLHYVVTYDGSEYYTTCELLWSTDSVIGEPAILFNTVSDVTYPFAIDWTSSSTLVLVANDTQQHTLKVERLELIEEPVEFVVYHTSTSEPTSSQGSDGDIWLVTE